MVLNRARRWPRWPLNGEVERSQSSLGALGSRTIIGHILRRSRKERQGSLGIIYLEGSQREGTGERESDKGVRRIVSKKEMGKVSKTSLGVFLNAQVSANVLMQTPDVVVSWFGPVEDV